MDILGEKISSVDIFRIFFNVWWTFFEESEEYLELFTRFFYLYLWIMGNRTFGLLGFSQFVLLDFFV